MFLKIQQQILKENPKKTEFDLKKMMWISWQSWSPTGMDLQTPLVW
jgi:hypothetical protein